MWTKYIVVGIVIVSFVSGDSIPFIQKCNAGDMKCQKESTIIALPIFAVGLPEYGVKPLDPLFVKEVDASTKTLKFLVTDATLTGLKGCKPKKVHLEADKLSMRMLCDLKFEGNYHMSGQLLFLPINGTGEMSMVLKSMQISFDSDVTDKVGPDGQTYLDFKSWKHAFELKEKAVLRFENLFQGNKVIGRAADEVIGGSPNEIFNELAPPIVKHVFEIFVDQVQDFFKNVAKKDLINESYQ